MHWASLLLGRDMSNGLLHALTHDLDISLRPKMHVTLQQAATEQRQAEAIAQHLQCRLLSLPSSHAVCLVEWCFLSRSIRTRASSRFDSLFFRRDEVKQVLLQQRKSCHELWAR